MNIIKRAYNKLIRCLVSSYLKRRGLHNDFILQMTTIGLIKDWKNCKKPLRDKIWAVKRGFYPSRIDFWGLNEDNYRNYMSDIDYRKLFPLNNRFQLWLDDKLTTKYVFQDSRIKDFMPRYFLYVENDGNYSYLMDFDDQIPKNSNALLNLLRQETVLALKPLAGSLGIGFIRLEIKQDEIYANNELLTSEKYEELKESLRGYLVTEYCHQHSRFAEVWPDSECTLRVVLAKQKNRYDGGEIIPILSYARFGTSLSSSTSNTSQGGVALPFDFETGICEEYFYRKKEFEKDGHIRHDDHPDTHVRMAGEKLPNWDIVKKGLYDIMNYFSTLEYFGFDVIITEDGFKICEINSMPELYLEQIMFGPILENETAKRYYTNKMKRL